MTLADYLSGYKARRLLRPSSQDMTDDVVPARRKPRVLPFPVRDYGLPVLESATCGRDGDPSVLYRRPEPRA